MATLLNMERLVLLVFLLHMAVGGTHGIGMLMRSCLPKKPVSPVVPPPVADTLFNDYLSRTAVEAYTGSTSQIETMVSKIENIYTMFKKDGLIYNSLDTYILYQEASLAGENEKMSPEIVKSEFKEKYMAAMKDNNDTLGILMKLMNQISSDVGVRDNTYLINVSDCSENIPYLYEPESGKHVWYPEYSHVAGILKFNIDNGEKDSSKIGYILLDPRYLNKPVVIIEGVNEVPFKHNSTVVQIKTNIAEDEHISWFPEGYTKGNTVPRQSVYIFGNYDPKYGGGEPSDKRQFAYNFKIPYLEFVDDMVKFNKYDKSITMLDENSKWMSKLSYLKIRKTKDLHKFIKKELIEYYQKRLKIRYYDDKLSKWVDGEFKEEGNKIVIDTTYETFRKKSPGKDGFEKDHKQIQPKDICKFFMSNWNNGPECEKYLVDLMKKMKDLKMFLDEYY